AHGVAVLGGRHIAASAVHLHAAGGVGDEVPVDAAAQVLSVGPGAALVDGAVAVVVGPVAGLAGQVEVAALPVDARGHAGADGPVAVPVDPRVVGRGVHVPARVGGPLGDELPAVGDVE